jgi:hypothetical protein
MEPSSCNASSQEVLEVVAALSGVTVAALLGPSRSRTISRVRSVAMHLLRTERGLAMGEVARVFGRSPATVYYLSRLVALGVRASDLVALGVHRHPRPHWLLQPLSSLSQRASADTVLVVRRHSGCRT